jgi:hypothetical protein
MLRRAVGTPTDILENFGTRLMRRRAPQITINSNNYVKMKPERNGT